MKNRGTLILSGLGLNCEKETAYACEQSGASRVDVVHTLRFLAGEINLKDYDFLIFIGGFLDGDYLGSARVGVNRLKYGSQDKVAARQQIEEFVKEGKLILGICNGFQLLVKLGLLPFDSDAFNQQTVSLTQNHNGRYEDRWVHLKVNKLTNSLFLKGIDTLYLPIRHGEGKIVIREENVRNQIINNNLAAAYYSDSSGMPTDTYPENPNGSWNNIAALSNENGTILGLMPHPEAYNHFTNHPHWTRLKFDQESGEGLKIFKQAYTHLS